MNAFRMSAALAGLLIVSLLSCTYKNPTMPGSTPALQLTAPAGNSLYLCGDTITLKWNTTEMVKSSVFVTVSSDSGRHFYRIVAGSSGGDSCKWIIGREIDRGNLNYPSDSVIIAIHDSLDLWADTLKKPLRVKYIALTNPQAGSTVHIGDSVKIIWRGKSLFYSSVEVLVSTDLGKTKADIASHSFGVSDSCKWTVGSEIVPPVPGYPRDSVLIIVKGYDPPYYSDMIMVKVVQ
jgi:hypothetical protein